MSFDLYFAGTQNEDCESFLLSSNSCRLQSQVNDRKNISRWCSEESHGKLFIDSGAYTVYTRGIELDVDAYIDYINSMAKWICKRVSAICEVGNCYKVEVQESEGNIAIYVED